MLTVCKALSAEPDFDFSFISDRERIVFFDIETTGLSFKNAGIYIIGTVSFEDGAWSSRQFFAESMADEQAVIGAFFDVINAKRKLGRVFLISFNGDGFDIPFIKNCIRQYGLSYDFNGLMSIDLLKLIRPYKKLLGLNECGLKSVERLCGIRRKDIYDGGELIYVYEEYLKLSSYTINDPVNLKEVKVKRQELLDTLLLHNAEDIADMPLIMGIAGYGELYRGGYDITGCGLIGDVWDINARLRMPLPKGIYYEDPHVTVSIGEEDRFKLNIAVQLFRGELKYFFADYKNYYYLPYEDTAIHKSVGIYTDRSARRQATARNCYTRRSGLFVPEPEPVFAPVFYEEYKKTPYFGEITKFIDKNGIKVDTDITKRYIDSILRMIKQSPCQG